MNSLFRFFAYIAPSLPTATSLAGAGTGLMLVFGGFVITRSTLQDYDLGAYYLSPFSWTVRSLVINGAKETLLSAQVLVHRNLGASLRPLLC